MTDYTVGTGSGGTLMIRDNGSSVEFWIKAGSTGTFINNPPGVKWHATYNGSTVNGATAYTTGAPWIMLHSFTITTTQTVTFSIDATGTSGLGGPTSISQLLNRSTAPAAPNNVGLTAINHRGMTYEFDDASNGGSAITSREYQVATSVAGLSSAPWLAAPSNGIVVRSDLMPGIVYYWRSRVSNAIGTSVPSSAISNSTLAGVSIIYGGVRRAAVPYVTYLGVRKPAVPYVTVGGVRRATAG